MNQNKKRWYRKFWRRRNLTWKYCKSWMSKSVFVLKMESWRMGDRLSLLSGISSLKWKTRFPKNAARINSETEEWKILCLNKISALVGLHDARGDHLEERTSNRSYRFASYKQFTCWIFRSFWKGNRRMILSCVFWIIQNLLPEPDSKYVLFTDRKKD